MTKTFKDIQGIEEACWVGYKKVGMKKKGDRMVPNCVKEEELDEAESLHKWFNRQGAKGKEKGWVDCNAPDGDGGYKSCGRKEGEKRSKYPACRPTPSACKDKGKGKTWGKTK